MRDDSTASSDDTPILHKDVELASKAASGDAVAREGVSHLVHSLIHNLTGIFCKRYCHENHLYARCTIFSDRGVHSKDGTLCDWGNHSYTWMLEDLTRPKRLMSYTGQNGARLSTYLHAIANSIPFYERWKDWRFGRRIRVPEFIQEISPVAGRIFWGIVAGHSLDAIAQQLRESIKMVEDIADKIIAELTERGKLNLLNTPKTISLTDLDRFDDDDGEEDNTIEGDIPDSSWDPGEDQSKNMIAEGLNKLSPVEQAVLEAMVIDERDATEVLADLVKAGISIKDGVPPEKIDRQQLYYFKRTTLAKLARLSGFTQ